MLISINPRPLRLHRPSASRLLAGLMVLLYLWIAFANLVSSAHDPIRWAGHEHAAILAAQSGDDGHAHDGHQADDRNLPNQHGQHTADHSHDKLNLQRSPIAVAVKIPRAWTSALRCPDYPEPCFSFERPPKHWLPV